MSNKGEFRAKTITWDEECPFLMIRGSIHQKDITIVSYKCLCA